MSMNKSIILNSSKAKVYKFWNKKSCGEALYLKKNNRKGYQLQSEERYRLEPEIISFADFLSTKRKKVLEIGVGLGAEHQYFAEAGAKLYGIDLTKRAVLHARRRLKLFKLSSKLSVGDAEALNFPKENFDYVYSWGVLHHTPNTPKAINEIHRVLKKNGIAKIMIYHKWSMVGIMLWVRYALLVGRPWTSLENIYAMYLESPGTKAYSVSEARQLFRDFRKVKITIKLSHADLLASNVGQRHRGILLNFIKRIWPAWFIRTFFPNLGLNMLIEVKK